MPDVRCEMPDWSLHSTAMQLAETKTSWLWFFESRVSNLSIRVVPASLLCIGFLVEEYLYHSKPTFLRSFYQLQLTLLAIGE